MCKNIQKHLIMVHSLSLVNTSRDASSSSRSLRQLRLRDIIGVTLIDREVVLIVARRIPNAIPVRHSVQPPAPAGPSLLIRAPFSGFRNPQSPLEFVEHPKADLSATFIRYVAKKGEKRKRGKGGSGLTYSPRNYHNIHQTQVRAEKERSLGIHLPRKLEQMTPELSSELVDPLLAVLVLRRLELQQPMESWDHAARHVVGPDAGFSARIIVLTSLRQDYPRGTQSIISHTTHSTLRINLYGNEYALTTRPVLRIVILEVLAQHGALVQAPAGRDLERGHEAARVRPHELRALVVRVDLDVLVRDALLLERDPRALHERAEPAREELQGLLGRVFLV